MNPFAVLIIALLGIAAFVLSILLTRLFGAWMLRINEIIDNQITQMEKMNEQIKLLRQIANGNKTTDDVKQEQPKEENKQ